MMNEMVKTNGTVKKNGKIAYISQESFLLNDTIKNNITFGMEYDEEKFKRTLTLCELDSDLEILDGREHTEIGERGINLSGGQKQRISIARAVYSEADIFLVDDALSALDAYVGKQIMNNVFQGELKGKTVIMVTHYLNLLSKGDKVALVVNGTVPLFESYTEIQKTDEFLEFSTIIEKEYEKKDKDEEEGEENEKTDKKRETAEVLSPLTKPKAPMGKLPPMDQKVVIKPAVPDKDKKE